MARKGDKKSKMAGDIWIREQERIARESIILEELKSTTDKRLCGQFIRKMLALTQVSKEKKDLAKNQPTSIQMSCIYAESTDGEKLTIDEQLSRLKDEDKWIAKNFSLKISPQLILSETDIDNLIAARPPLELLEKCVLRGKELFVQEFATLKAQRQ